MTYTKERWQQLAGLKKSDEVNGKEQLPTLTESFRSFGMANPGVLGNPFAHSTDEKVLEEVAPDLDSEKTNVEHDDEGKMAKDQLEQIKSQAEQLLAKLSDNAQLEGWVQSKLTLAAEMLDVVTHYLQDELSTEDKDKNEDDENEDEDEGEDEEVELNLSNNDEETE